MLNLETKVGAMIVTGILAVVMAIFLVNDWSFARQNYEITAMFKNAGGLKVGSPVSVAGVHVGKLKDVELLGNKVAMTLEIQKKFQIPEGSRFVIIASGVLGDKFIEITPNTESGRMLQPGSKVEGENVQDMNQAISQAVDTMSEVQDLTANFNDIVGDDEFKKAVGEAIVSLAETMKNMNQLIGSLQQVTASQQGNIANIIENMSVMSGNMAAASNDIRQLLHDVEADGATAGKMQQILTNLDQATAKAAQITRDVQSLTGDKQLQDDLKGTLHNVNEVSGKANKLLSSAGNTKVKFLLEGQSSSTEHKLKTTANMMIFPRQDQFFLLGLTNMNDDNKFNLQLGQKLNRRLEFKAGLFQDCVGVALNQHLGDKFSLEGQLSTDHDSHFQMKARYHLKPDLAFSYQHNNIFGSGDKEFNLGVETLF